MVFLILEAYNIMVIETAHNTMNNNESNIRNMQQQEISMDS